MNNSNLSIAIPIPLECLHAHHEHIYFVTMHVALGWLYTHPDKKINRFDFFFSQWWLH
jgi:hypothetical protein